MTANGGMDLFSLKLVKNLGTQTRKAFCPSCLNFYAAARIPGISWVCVEWLMKAWLTLWFRVGFSKKKDWHRRQTLPEQNKCLVSGCYIRSCLLNRSCSDIRPIELGLKSHMTFRVHCVINLQKFAVLPALRILQRQEKQMDKPTAPSFVEYRKHACGCVCVQVHFCVSSKMLLQCGCLLNVLWLIFYD